ncbi:hypothetical protein QFZ45_001854 [Pseudomonas synxantha]|nr:hypothetical protein [Pseudomonas synxantha]
MALLSVMSNYLSIRGKFFIKFYVLSEKGAETYFNFKVVVALENVR